MVHPSGPKENYNYHLSAMDRAMAAGIDDVGIGVLFGLYNYKFEVLAMLYHALHLEKEFGVGPHTISVPRIEPALGAVIAHMPPYPVSDLDFKKLVAILRLAVPYTGLILSTRESAPMRNELISLGISQISAGSRTNPGGYVEERNDCAAQFALSDERSTSEVILDVMKLGYIPSFCTACYRLGRTGKKFMGLAKPGEIHAFCQPNALLTLKEYLEDYSKDGEKETGEKLISKQLKKITNTKMRKFSQDKLKEIESGKRDLYF
jgi:2-iminoacetate synthase